MQKNKIFSRETLSNYMFVLKTAKIKKSKIFIILFYTFIIVALDALGIGILLPISEYILNQGNNQIPETKSWSIITKIFSFLKIQPNIIIVTIAAINIVILRQILNYLKAVTIQSTRYNVELEFRKLLFERYLKIDFLYIKNFTTGKFNNIINSEVEKVAISSIAPVECISSLILLISYLILMLLISIKATFLVMFIGCLTLLPLKRILYKVASTAKTVIKINNNFSQNLIERLLALKMIRLNQTLNSEIVKNNSILDQQYLKNIYLIKIQALANTSIEPFLLIIAIPIIIYSVIIGFALTKLGLLIILLARLIPIFRSSYNTFQAYINYSVSTTNMVELLEKVRNQEEKRAGTEALSNQISSIKFQSVYFKYIDSNRYILKNFSCKFEGGKINAVIGESGVGKSTLINILVRLLEPQQGKVMINNINIKNLSIKSLRNACSYIDQKPILFRGTVYENITYQNKVSLRKCIEASKLCNAHRFINQLDKKYNYILGEAGVGLSGGQLQRIEIVKAIVSAKPIMILDEPTSNLDDENKEEILNTLKVINKEKKTTIIIISHDRNVLEYCDNKVFL